MIGSKGQCPRIAIIDIAIGASDDANVCRVRIEARDSGGTCIVNAPISYNVTLSGQITGNGLASDAPDAVRVTRGALMATLVTGKSFVMQCDRNGILAIEIEDQASRPFVVVAQCGPVVAVGRPLAEDDYGE